MVNFLTCIHDRDSHSPTLMDLFISSNANICSTMSFTPLGNSGHVAVSVSTNFLSNQKGLPHFIKQLLTILMLIVSLCDYLRDVTCTWVDILKLGAYAAASEFCEWVQARTNVCIPHCKYQVKSHSSPWFSPGCAAIAH